AAEHGDVLLDLHSGGDLTITAFYVIYTKGHAESQRLAAAVGSRYQWGSDEGWLKGALFSNYTRRTGKPAIIVETGGGGRVTEQDLANYQTALGGLTRALGMTAGATPMANDIRGGGNAVHAKATSGGFWQPQGAPGDDDLALFRQRTAALGLAFNDDDLAELLRGWAGLQPQLARLRRGLADAARDDEDPA